VDKRKNNGGHSTKGFAGRKPKDEENRIRDLMRPYSLDAVQCLANIIVNAKSKDADKISASKLILAYTYGNPKDTIEQTTNISSINIKDLFSIDKIK
jgi:hypothetical protein